MDNEGRCEAEQRMRRVRKSRRKKECKRGQKERSEEDIRKFRTTLRYGNVSFCNSRRTDLFVRALVLTLSRVDLRLETVCLKNAFMDITGFPTVV